MQDDGTITPNRLEMLEVLARHGFTFQPFDGIRGANYANGGARCFIGHEAATDWFSLWPALNEDRRVGESAKDLRAALVGC